MSLNEALMVKVLVTCKKVLNIMDKTVIYHFLECVLPNVLFISLKKIIQKNFLTFIRTEKEDVT